MEIPLVTSDVDARQEGHVFDEFGEIGIPHMQHSTFTMVPAATSDIFVDI